MAAEIARQQSWIAKLRAENAELKAENETLRLIGRAMRDGKPTEASSLSRDELMAVFGKRDALVERLREENLAYEVEIGLLEAEVARRPGVPGQK